MRYECPNCKSQLKFWKQYGFNKERLVNKKTGSLNKIEKRSKEEFELYTQGLACTKCDFVYFNVANNEIEYENLNHIFDKI